MDTDPLAANPDVSTAVRPSEQTVIAPTTIGKSADKPHRLTVLLSAGALILSIIGIVVSGFSVYYTRLALRVGQRAYLSVTPTL